MDTHTIRIYWLESKYEFLKLLRLPAYSVPTILFPVMFYVLFGLMLPTPHISGGMTMATYLIATYGAFAVIGASMFGFGVGVATERGLGWLQVKRASPMPPAGYFAAKLAMSMLFSLIAVLLLFLLGAMFGGVRLPAASWPALAGVLVAGALPFGALGLAIGYLAGPNSAPAMVNLIYLPMAFLSGLWIPLPFLPSFVRHAAPLLPPYHLAQLTLAIIGAGPEGPALGHMAALTGFTALFLLLALWGYRRDSGKMYG